MRLKLGESYESRGFSTKNEELGYRENFETIRRIYGISIVSAYAIVWP